MEGKTPVRLGAERRSEPRIACNNTAAELTIIHSGIDTVTSIPAIVVDASKSGLRVVANIRTSRGQQVRIKMENLIIFGEVRHSRAQGTMFESGVKISDVVGDRGLCDRLTEEEIELLALGRGLPAMKRAYARYHVHHCKPCGEQFRATEQFFSKLHTLGGADVEQPCSSARKGI